jgi:hypothetical protein
MELLELTGQLLRVALEDTMYNVIDAAWKANAGQRERLERELQDQHARKRARQLPSSTAASTPEGSENGEPAADDVESSGSSFMGFARFMAR